MKSYRKGHIISTDSAENAKSQLRIFGFPDNINCTFDNNSHFDLDDYISTTHIEHMTPPQVIIGIVTYNSMDCIPNCLASITQQTWPNYKVCILDNGSSDGTHDWLKQHAKPHEILLKSSNLGFSGGHNTIIARHSSDYYIPLNPDVVLEPYFIEKMICCAETDNSIGWVSGKILFPKENNDSICKIYSAGHAVFTNGKFTNIGYGEMDNGQFNTPCEVFGANGAAPLYRRKMLDDIMLPGQQYFDELFFLYGTDTDLDWRARLQGWICRYTPEAIAWHSAQGSCGLNDPQIRIDYIRRRYVFLLKNMFTYPLIHHYIPLIMSDYRTAKADMDCETIAAIKSIHPFLREILSKRRFIMKHAKKRRKNLLKWMQQPSF